MKVSFITLLLLKILFVNFSNAQWIPTNGPGNPAICFVSYGSNLFAGASGGIFLSINNGDNWIPRGLQNLVITAIGMNGQNLYAGCLGSSNSVLYKSTDLGITWVQLNMSDKQSDNNQKVVVIHFITSYNGRIYVGRSITNQNMAVLSVSTDDGSTWINSSNGLTMYDIYKLTQQGTNLFLATTGGVYSSSNSGTNWSHFGLSSSTSIASINNYLFANDGYSLFFTSNNGTNWNNINPVNDQVENYVTFNQYLFAKYLTRVFISSNYGNTWVNITDNFIGSFYSLFIFPPYIFAGSNNGTVYRRNLGDLTSVGNINNNIPKQFSLSQNYPNPFNPSTIINYEILVTGNVKLIVYDELGRDIKTLVNEKQNAGSYKVEFDGSNLPSGVYFYKLTAGDFAETKKLVLLK